MKKAIVTVLMCCIMLLQTSAVFAWEQSTESQTHQQINFEAIKLFANRFSNLEKYKFGPVDINSAQRYRGIAVTSSSKFIDPKVDSNKSSWTKKYAIAEQDLTMTQWIVWGGAWADEPHLYASVRHFYDPVMEPRYLTDQSEAHGLYDSPQMDARKWGLDAEDNPFNFYNALLYYKKALETPESELPTERLTPTHFKLNLNIVPANRADERNIYLARSYRALGESMHMLADMTQPAHVRNDSHPISEPVEQTITSGDVMAAARSGMVEPRIGQYLMSAGAGSVLEPWELFRQVALFTNQNFYSSDTIYDKKSRVLPDNGDKQYPHPQFDELTLETKEIALGDLFRKLFTYYGTFMGQKIPMIQQTLTYSLEGGALLASWHVPPSFAKAQGSILLPVAIHACADLVHLFFPTLELKAEYNDLGDQSREVEGKKDYQRQVIEVDATMVHRQADDPAWEKMGLKIDYSGPGELVFEKKGKVTKTRKLNFEKGKVVAIEGHKGGMVERSLEVYVMSGDNKLIAEEAFYEAEKGNSLYIKIDAGSRVFKSPVFDIGEGFEVVIQPPRIMTYELKQGATDATHEFKAIARPEGQYTFEWDFDDGNTKTQKGKSSTVKNTYKGVGDYYPTVSLYDKGGTLLAKDTANIKLTEKTDSDWLEKLHATERIKIAIQHHGGYGWSYRIDDIKWSGTSFSSYVLHDEKDTRGNQILTGSTTVTGNFINGGKALNLEIKSHKESMEYRAIMEKTKVVGWKEISRIPSHENIILQDIPTYREFHAKYLGLGEDHITYTKKSPAYCLFVNTGQLTGPDYDHYIKMWDVYIKSVGKSVKMELDRDNTRIQMHIGTREDFDW